MKELGWELRGSLPGGGGGQELSRPGGEGPWPRGGEAPGVKPGRPQPGTPGVHLGAGAPGLMAASEPACEGLFFPEA